MALPSFKSALKSDNAVMVGLAEGAVIAAVYQHAIPSMADVRTATPHNSDIEASRKRAALESAAILGLVFLMTRDVNSFLIGGLMLTAIDLHVKHANGVHPATGKLAPGGSITDNSVAVSGNTEAFSLPDYGGADDGLGGDG